MAAQRRPPTQNPTERAIHASGRAGSAIATTLKEKLEQRSTATVGREHPDLSPRTDLFYEDGIIRKAVEVKYSETSKICRECRVHMGGGCACAAGWIPTHKNCHQRCKEAMGSCAFWSKITEKRGELWGFHFIFVDLCDPGSLPTSCPADDLITIMQQWNIRVKVYTEIPRDSDFAWMVDWIRTP